MRKVFIMLAVALLPLMAGAQAQINTKKVKISDFTEKITKVVLTGNDFYDIALQDEVKARWRVSPYEFCTWDEFQKDRNSSDFYFLLTTSSQFKKESEPGLDLLSLVKGGTGATINSMLEVVFIPFAPAEDPSGREMVFLPAFLDIIQKHALMSMEKDTDGYIGLSNNSMNIAKAKNMEFVFSEDDLSSEITREFRDLNFDSDMVITDEDSADDYMLENAPNTLVSYVVAPTDAQPGSFCYKMLINSETHELYYFRRHRITKKFGPGFLAEDIRRINSYRGRK
ncbi:MAG: hypothetical protein IJB05_07695 [Bacteroidales bacterium]|nr:hypothetical protein [Bacteroidales bacterium]